MDYGSISLKRTNLAPIAETGSGEPATMMVAGAARANKRPTKPDKYSQRAFYKKQQSSQGSGAYGPRTGSNHQATFGRRKDSPPGLGDEERDHVINGEIYEVGFQSHDTTSSSLTHVRHHRTTLIDVETLKDEFGPRSNTATTPTGKNAASKPRDICGTTQGMIDKARWHGMSS